MVCSEGNIFLPEIESAVSQNKPVFVGLSLQLGVDSVNAEYLESISQMLQIDLCCGIAGGRGHGSYYFFGIVNENED